MIRLATIVINTENPATLANFWTAFMCTEVESTAPGFTWLKAVHGGPRIALQEVMYPSEGPRRLHMDFATDDVDTEVARAVSLGATRVEEHTFPDFR